MTERSVGRSDAGRSITVSPGDVLLVRVEENLATGYSWELASLPPSCRLEESSHEAAAGGRMGAPGTRVLRIAVAGVGAGRVDLRLRRPWDPPGQVADDFSFSVQAQ